MRTIAAAVLALALPSTAQAQFTPQPLPRTGYGLPPIAGGDTTRQAPIALERRLDDGPGPAAIDPRPVVGPITVGRELDRARRDIERLRDSGELSRSEVKQLRREARRIDAMTERYGRDGFSEFERRELELRASELRNRTATGRTS